MKVLAFNGSPRKNRNTATLLNKALEGAASQNAETELIHLYDINYKGCASCFSCKLIGGKSYGKCALRDDLTPILKKVEEADAIVLGSPVYFGAVTGEMKSFIERLLFPYWTYSANFTSLFNKKIQTGLIFTMGATESMAKEYNIEQSFGFIEMASKMLLGPTETLMVTGTYQFDDYSRYETSGLNETETAKRRKEVFPDDCRKAYEMGIRLLTQQPESVG